MQKLVPMESGVHPGPIYYGDICLGGGETMQIKPHMNILNTGSESGWIMELTNKSLISCLFSQAGCMTIAHKRAAGLFIS